MKVIIYFADSSTLTLSPDDVLVPIAAAFHDGEYIVGPGKLFSVYQHHHDGFITPLVEFFANSEFFYVGNNKNIAYSSKNIVRIEQC